MSCFLCTVSTTGKCGYDAQKTSVLYTRHETFQKGKFAGRNWFLRQIYYLLALGKMLNKDTEKDTKKHLVSLM